MARRITWAIGVSAVLAASHSVRGRRALTLLAGAAAISVGLAIGPAAAQQLRGSGAALAPGLRLHAVNPSLSLTAPANTPLQQQMQNDYATGLIDAQRQLLLQNPSGTTREELSIGSQLNGYTGPR
jgi:hypothetical protein